MAKEFTFDDLNEALSKVSILGSKLNENEVSKVSEYIHSGNYHLNACLTGSIFRGYPSNRAIQLSGPSGTGKTYLLLNAIREAQKMGYYVVFYDSENAVDSELAEKFGIDTTKIRYEPVGTVQEFRTSVTNLTKVLIEKKRDGTTIPKILIALDSAGNLATQKEIDDAVSGSEKADMTRAKILKSIFRIMMIRLGEINSLFIFTNHTYQTQSFISMEVSGGGRGPEYGASIILFLGKAQLKEGDSKTGIIVKAKPNKNRFSIPTPIKFHIHYTKGMNKYVGLENYISWETCGIEKGIIITEKEIEKVGKKIEKEKSEIKKKKMILAGELVAATKFKVDDEDSYFVDPDNGKMLGIGGTSKGLAVRHLGRSIDGSELFTSKVFTKEVLESINEIIKENFEYADDDSAELEQIDTLLKDEIKAIKGTGDAGPG